MRNQQPTGLFAAAFWQNPEISNASRLLLMGLLALIPGSYLAAQFLVRHESCLTDTRRVYLAIIAVLLAHTIYFWNVDRPKVVSYFSRMLAAGTLEIERRWFLFRTRPFYYDAYARPEYRGTRRVLRLPLIMLLYLVVLLAWCFHDKVQSFVCAGPGDGQAFGLFMAGAAFVLVLVHEVLLWTVATTFTWKIAA